MRNQGARPRLTRELHRKLHTSSCTATPRSRSSMARRIPTELVDRAIELGYHALALTDHDELGGIVAFAQAGDGDALECIIGSEITVRGDGGVPHHLVLLAEDRTGYGNLSTLVTRARMDSTARAPLAVARHRRRAREGTVRPHRLPARARSAQADRR